MKSNTSVKRKSKLSVEQKFPRYWRERNHEDGQIVVGSDDLKCYGILENDTLLYDKTNKFSENDLCVWEHSASCFDDGESRIYGAFAYDNFGDITLHRNNELVGRYDAKDIKLLGVVSHLTREFSTGDKILFAEESEITHGTTERSVTCKNCRAQLIGSTEFLKGMGWQLKENDVLCVNCW